MKIKCKKCNTDVLIDKKDLKKASKITCPACNHKMIIKSKQKKDPGKDMKKIEPDLDININNQNINHQNFNNNLSEMSIDQNSNNKSESDNNLDNEYESDNYLNNEYESDNNSNKSEIDNNSNNKSESDNNSNNKSKTQKKINDKSKYLINSEGIDIDDSNNIYKSENNIVHYLTIASIITLLVFTILWAFIKQYYPDFIIILVLIIGLGIYIKPTFENIIAGIWIKIDGLIHDDDWIQIQEIEGKVLCINYKTTHIKTRCGSEVIIPNSKLINSNINRYNKDGKYCICLSVNVNYENKPERVKKILLDAVLPFDGVLKNPEPQIVFEGLFDNFARYIVSFYINDYSEKFKFQEDIWTRIWMLLKRSNIDYDYKVTQIVKSDDFTEVQQDPSSILEEVDIFRPFSEYAISALGQQMKSKNFKTGETIVKQGDKGNSLFVIEEGVIGVKVLLEKNKYIEVARLGAGSFFGEMALLTGEPRTASIVSITDTHLYEITKDHIAPLIDEQPEIFKPLSEELVRRKMSTEIQKSKHQPFQINQSSLIKQYHAKMQNFFNN